MIKKTIITLYIFGILILCGNTSTYAKYVKNTRAKLADINIKKTYSIEIKYIDIKAEEQIDCDIIDNLEQGYEYSITPKEIEGYFLESDSNATTGKIEDENIEIEYYYRPNGVFAKCYDTNVDGNIDTLVLNNTPKFSYEGIQKLDFQNQDNNDFQQDSTNNTPIWYDILKNVKSVIILNDIIPLKYTTRWFDEGKNIERIEGIDNIKTYKVSIMNHMFKNCEKLKKLDLSGFDTKNVETMRGMFYRCYKLENLNLSSFDTHKVETMQVMFTNCERLQELDLSNFDTTNVTTMESMFCNCLSLTNLNVTSFNTENTTKMIDMFSQCNNLKSLDISSFNTTKVNNMYGMFYRCTELRTVYIGKYWTTANVTNSQIMFSGDYKLVGSKGTTYTSSHVDKIYAREDKGSSAPGYFTLKNSSKKNMEILENGTAIDKEYEKKELVNEENRVVELNDIENEFNDILNESENETINNIVTE